DAAKKETYERVRKGGKFDRLIANIRAINRAKERHGSAIPEIALNIVLMKSNITELPALIELAHELKVSGVSAAHLTPYEGVNIEAESLERDMDLCNRMLDEARAVAARLQIGVSLPDNFDTNSASVSLLKLGTSLLHKPEPVPTAAPAPRLAPAVFEVKARHEASFFGLNIREDEDRTHCLFPWHFAIIGPEHEVQPCGWWFDTPLGDIRKNTFEEIWNNDEFRALRAERESGKLRHNCQTCPAAGMGNQNQKNAFVVKAFI